MVVDGEALKMENNSSIKVYEKGQVDVKSVQEHSKDLILAKSFNMASILFHSVHFAELFLNYG